MPNPFYAPKLTDLISNKVGCITKAEMRLIGTLLYCHTCCHGWVEVEALLEGKIQRMPEAFSIK